MTSKLFQGSAYNISYDIVCFAASFIGLIASLLVIFLIHRMRINTGHMWLIITMSIYQLIYDFQSFFVDVGLNFYVTLFFFGCGIASGISGAITSNWLAFATCYIVIYRKKFNIFEYKHLIFWSSFLPGISLALIYCAAALPESNPNTVVMNIAFLDIYYYLRIASVLVNFAFVGIIFQKISKFGANNAHISSQQRAIRTMSQRLMYYPLVQAVGRVGYAIYEKIYGGDFTIEDPSPLQFSILIASAILNDFISVGYFAIFLTMQPEAYKHFTSLLKCAKYEGGSSNLDSEELSIKSPIIHLTIEDTINSRDTEVSVFNVRNSSVASWWAGALSEAKADIRDENALIDLMAESEGDSTENTRQLSTNHRSSFQII